MDELIIAANRSILDFKENELLEGKLNGFGSGGLAQAMLGILKDNKNYHTTWIGTAMGDADEMVLDGFFTDMFRQYKIEKISPTNFPDVSQIGHNKLKIEFMDYLFDIKKITLEQKVRDRFYDNFSNSFLWGLMHNSNRLLHRELEEFPEPVFSDIDFYHYMTANVLFSDSIFEELSQSIEAKDRPDIPKVVWLQDYHLFASSMFLRDEIASSEFNDSNIKIGQFIHTPFPDIIKVLSNYFSLNKSEEETFMKLTFGLLGNDFVGFHIPKYAKNFIESISYYASEFPGFWKNKRITDIERTEQGIISYVSNGINRTTNVGAYPIGVETDRILMEVSPDQKFKSEVQGHSLEGIINYSKSHNKTVFGGLERKDFTKGIPKKLEIFYEFINRYGNALLIQNSEPSRETSPAYKELESIIDNKFAKIFSLNPGETANYAIHNKEGLRQPQNYRFMRDVDVLMITTEEDGMNLVVFEGILSKKYTEYDQRGIIVLGQNGASEVLKDYDTEDGLVRVGNLNPYEAAEKINYALESRKKISDRLIEFVETNCRVDKWAEKNIHTIKTGEYSGPQIF